MTHEEIEGWFDYESLYYEQVRRARDGARFVEVGAWKGKSTAYLAKAIKDSGKQIKLTVVDTWEGSPVSPANEPCSKEKATTQMLEEFSANMAACGVSEIVTPLKMDSLEAATQFEDESLDFVFIDGDHRTEAVLADLRAWYPKVKPGGLIAGHDYNESGPKTGAKRFAEEMGRAIYGDGANTPDGYRCFGIPKPIKERVSILLALPNYDGTAQVKGVLNAALRAYSGPAVMGIPEQATSLLASNFNSLWCMALNDPTITHFAMLHSDIVPMHWWLDVLMHELIAEEAQLVSAVIPIKDKCGVTSTGVANPAFEWAPLRRFTMPEVLAMPATFSAKQAGYPNHKLVLNTGCWMADMRDPRWKTLDSKGELFCHFEINNRITKEDGLWIPWCEPEDFFFSKRVQSLGMKAVATRKVQASHIGPAVYPNDTPWGEWKNGDEATKALWNSGAPRQ